MFFKERPKFTSDQQSSRTERVKGNQKKKTPEEKVKAPSANHAEKLQSREKESA